MSSESARCHVLAQARQLGNALSTEKTMTRIGRLILWIFLAPGDWVADRLGVTADQNRDLVRMLVNSLFWILVAVFGLATWTSGLSIYQ